MPPSGESSSFLLVFWESDSFEGMQVRCGKKCKSCGEDKGAKFPKMLL